ncbi:hypothetical protein AK812_SmicGene6070 [Symbiodinium microadriaticum]|uniref:Uncharacterized protein n=1 Tax=Symbiodinium microadriaticum TaxID=2951 RepID=A0A1Q9ES77_SYMMI|nr:hypothetical protein AK812_SmicGene6070 [Symbiodinium microadriaticum]
MASALIEQINTVSKLTRTIKDEKSRADLLSAQAVSIREQIMNVTLTSSDCDQLVEAIDQSDFSDESKTELGKAVLQQLGKAAKKVPKRSNQTVEDLGPFLTTTDVEMLTNVDMTLLSKVQRLATVLARIGCMNPTEPTYGKALTLLKKHFHMSSLQDPKTFYDSVQDLKASLKSQKTWGLPTVHITTYSTPDALPQELFDRAFSEEKPAGFQATVMGRLGPLRKSSLAIREESSGSAGPGPFMLNLAGTRPNPQFTNTPMMNPMMHTMMNSFMGVAPIATPPRASTMPASAAEQLPPLSPSEQANAMMAAWNAKADQKRDEQMGDDDQDTGADDVMKRPCMKRPAANGIGGGHDLPNTKPKSKAKSQPKSKAKSQPKSKAGSKPKHDVTKLSQSQRLRLRPSVLVADESALKHSMENKGASGSLFCVRCTNIIGHKNAVADFSKDFVLSTCVDSAQFRLHTNASTRQLLEYLRDAEQSMSCAAFAKLQTSVGFNFKSSGLLMDDMIGYDIPETVMYDWFHIYLVHGVCNIECGLVLGGLRDAGFPESDITEFLQSFNWPAQTAGSSPKNILQAAREKKTSPLKASASELLNFVPVLRLFVLLFVCGRVDSATECKVHSFLLLVQVLDLLQIVARGGSTTAAELGAAIRKHLECHLKAHGDESWIPKMHMSLHLAEFLQRFGTLISCFVHERKHKLIKRFASQKQDTTKKYEESLLQDIMAVQLQALKQDMPSTEVRLLHKAKATKKLHELMHETLQCGGGHECFHALRAVHGGGFECSRGDVVEFSCMGTSSFGRIQFHAEMMDRPMTCIVPWSHVHDWAYTVTESAQPVLVDTGAIKGCCLWSQKGTSALVIRA